MIKDDKGIKKLGIFLGGMRCGSTAINDYLKHHPEVCMYKKKDPHFFSGNEQWKAGWDNYLSGWHEFDSSLHKIAFESSTHYTKYPMYKDTAERMASAPFDMRLIYGVRPPIERVESHFIHNAGKGYYNPEDREERLKLLKQAINVSNFDMQIQRFEKYFSPYQLFVMDTRDLIKQPQKTLSSICEFLGVNSSYEFELIERRPRKFKNDISAITLSDEERDIASRELKEPIQRFEKRYKMSLWDGD